MLAEESKDDEFETMKQIGELPHKLKEKYYTANQYNREHHSNNRNKTASEKGIAYRAESQPPSTSEDDEDDDSRDEFVTANEMETDEDSMFKDANSTSLFAGKPRMSHVSLSRIFPDNKLVA